MKGMVGKYILALSIPVIHKTKENHQTRKERMNNDEVKAYQKAYYKANSEKIKAQRKARYKANREKEREWGRAYYKANKEIRKARSKTWTQANPEKIKRRSKLYHVAHKEKVNAQSSAWRKANLEKTREYKRKHRALKYQTHTEPINEKRVFIRDGWICQICKKRVDKRFRYPNPMCASLDHILPLSKGGSHTYRNVQLVHLGCNTKKGVNVLPQGEQRRLF